ncbi:MAG TPA: hypothetical protein VFG52_09255, partial [Xanthomonadales bacterium]|nr:hypothetical protein [Xanthomonadales bacterium]
MLPGCATAPQATAYCSANGYAFHADFPGAALYSCNEGKNGPELVIAPEFAPINPSPWYAYRITALQPSGSQGAVTITQRYIHGQHRYPPWIRQHGEEWKLLPADRVELAEDRSSFSYQLVVPATGVEISAQPPLGVAESQAWAQHLANGHQLQHHELLQ